MRKKAQCEIERVMAHAYGPLGVVPIAGAGRIPSVSGMCVWASCKRKIPPLPLDVTSWDLDPLILNSLEGGGRDGDKGATTEAKNINNISAPSGAADG